MSTLRPLHKGSAIFSEMFRGYGITHTFHMESILRHTLIELEKMGIRRVLTHSEKAAAYMADGYARCKGGPGLCLCQSVGAANLAAGLQDAYLSHSPVIAITGRKPSSEKYRNTYQEIDHWPLFEPVTKSNISIENTMELPQALRQAFRTAVSGAPGPVHLDCPQHQGFLIDTGETDSPIIIEERFKQIPPFRPFPDPVDIAEVVRQIYAAERPIFIFGLGAVLSKANESLLAMVNALGIPFATTVDGKDIIQNDHPLCLGPVGSYGRKCANAVVADADLVIYFGSGVSDQVTVNWSIPTWNTKVIQVDIDPLELGRNYPNSASIMGDVRATADAIVNALTGHHTNVSWGKKATETVNTWRQALVAAQTSNETPIRVERLCLEISKILPSNGSLVVDTGFSAIWSASVMELLRPGQRYFRPAGGSLGWGFPASLGVKCAAPDRPVVCFTGDGAFWYHMSEVETAVRHNINTVTIINNNGGFAQCIPGIKGAYDGTPGRLEDLYLYGPTNFAAICEKMGAFALRVEKTADIAPAMQAAYASNRPAVVEVVTDIKSDPLRY